MVSIFNELIETKRKLYQHIFSLQFSLINLLQIEVNEINVDDGK